MAERDDKNDRFMTIVNGIVVDDPEAEAYGGQSFVGMYFDPHTREFTKPAEAAKPTPIKD